MLDYVRHYGEEAIGGMNFVDGMTKLGSEEANSVITPEFFSLAPSFFSADVEESVRSLRSLVQMCFTQELSAEDTCGPFANVSRYRPFQASRAPAPGRRSVHLCGPMSSTMNT